MSIGLVFIAVKLTGNGFSNSSSSTLFEVKRTAICFLIPCPAAQP